MKHFVVVLKSGQATYIDAGDTDDRSVSIGYQAPEKLGEEGRYYIGSPYRPVALFRASEIAGIYEQPGEEGGEAE